ERLGEPVALGGVAAELAEPFRLLFGFDAFGDDGELERLGQFDDGPDDGRFDGVAGDVVDEDLVDLQDVDREATQVAERRVPGAEVVDGQLDTELLELPQAGGDQRAVVEEDALGQLEDQRGRVKAGAVEGGGHGRDDVGLEQLVRGQIDGHAE